MLRPLLPLLIFAITLASKDDSYYIPGTGNPNVNEDMYWKDAENVLQDLSQFSALYVRFHKCAWTWMQYEDDGNDVDENDYWYMGKIPPMGANVAFSLYGKLKNKSSFSGCDSSTFINSFYTNQGFTDFETAMQYAGVSAFSNNGGSGYTAECGGGYGVGCDTVNGFALHKYSTSTCNPDMVSSVMDEMYNMNQAMASVDCVKIYDGSSYSSNDDADGDDGYSYYGTALGLLETSHACFYQNVWSPDGECPDPYGKISKYQKNFGKAIEKSATTTPVAIYKKKTIYERKIRKGKSMTIGGAILVVAACIVMATDKVISKIIDRKMGGYSVSTTSSSPPRGSQHEEYVAYNT